MVEAVRRMVNSVIVRGAFVMASPVLASAALAEQLLDPTRPPEVVGSGQSATVSAGPILQSVLISPQRKVAIISGKTVKLGEKFGESRVVSITETEVVLQNGKKVQTLKLFPGVQKRLTATQVNSKTDQRRQQVEIGR